jgi:hypothetical protein
VSEPTVYAIGTIMRTDPLTPGNTGDIMFAHPFGNDFNFDVSVDPAFAQLNYISQGADPAKGLHVEIEHGLTGAGASGFPYDDFGWNPQVGDSVLVDGDWIVDCGHPASYQSEIHPPQFVVLARTQDLKTTTALAVANPFRPTQLYNPTEKLAYDFTNFKRFLDANSKPFFDHLVDEVNNVVFNFSQVMEAHALVQPTNLTDGVEAWSVCAPTPQPASTKLTFSYHFTARTGMFVSVSPFQNHPGCVDFLAIGNDTPYPDTPATDTWPWPEINQQASEQLGMPVNVKDRIHQLLEDRNWYIWPYSGINADPLIDRYSDLAPRLSGASANSPNGVTVGANDQPFPFYGRIKVGWSACPGCLSHLNCGPLVCGRPATPREMAKLLAPYKGLGRRLTPRIVRVVPPEHAGHAPLTIHEFGRPAPPSIIITAPPPPQPSGGVFEFPNGFSAPIHFIAHAHDADGTALTGLAISWTDDRDGALGTSPIGANFLDHTLSGGGCAITRHHVTATVSGSRGLMASDSITVDVGYIC